MYLLEVFNGIHHFLNLFTDTVLFINVVIVWYEKIKLTKNMQLSNKLQKLRVSKTNLRFCEVFSGIGGLIHAIHFFGFHLRWGSDIQFLVDNVEASHLYGLQVNRRGIPKAGHVGVMARAGSTSRSVGVVFFGRSSLPQRWKRYEVRVTRAEG